MDQPIQPHLDLQMVIIYTSMYFNSTSFSYLHSHIVILPSEIVVCEGIKTAGRNQGPSSSSSNIPGVSVIGGDDADYTIEFLSPTGKQFDIYTLNNVHTHIHIGKYLTNTCMI